ncbi:MAG: hypothetical protein GY829_00180 [Gammaproteobacteria bacterium]|nr:hypothetical protein [Gammaproteobacteria bacterium]
MDIYRSYKHITVLFLILVLFVSGCASISESDNLALKNKKLFTPQQLRQDLQFLEKSLLQIHPEPFARLPIEKYQTQYDQAYSELSGPMRRQDFYRVVAPLVSQFSDIHMRLLFPPEEYQQYLEQKGKFPLALLYSSDGLIVVADQQDIPIIPIGAEILTINDIGIEAILEKFEQYVPVETTTGLQRIIQMEFPRLLWSIYGFDNHYQVSYLWQGKVIRQEVKGVKQNLTALHQQLVTSHYGVIPINKMTSLMWLNDFNEQYDKFEDFLHEQFQIMREQDKDNLILDLRYNQGGITDNLALLLSYLSSEPVSWATNGTLKLSKAFRQQHSVLLENAKYEKYGNYLYWLPVEYLNLLQWKILFASDGEWLDTDINPVISDKEEIFKGKIFVLSNGFCLSACASLTAVLQDNNLATIIGESPGNLTKVQYGYPVSVKLPNTEFQLTIPAIKFVRDGDKGNLYNRRPDYPIERTKKDVISGKDPIFNLALELSRP